MSKICSERSGDGSIVVGNTVVLNRKQHDTPGDAINIGRGDGSLLEGTVGDGWGSPHPLSEIERTEGVSSAEARQLSVSRFERDLVAKLKQDGEVGERWRTAVAQLQGETLVCWCAPKACHGEILAHWAERLAPYY